MLNAIIHALPMAAYLCDNEGLITAFNERASELWGRAPLLNDPKDRFCGAFMLYDAQGHSIAHRDCWMAKALRERKSFNGCEIVIERKDGSRRHVLVNASPLIVKGEMQGAINLLTEIPATVLFSEPAFGDLFEGLFNYSPEGVLFTRTDGTILRANDAACRMLQYSESEIRLLGRSGLLKLPDGVEAPDINQFRESNGTLQMEAELVRRDGTLLPVSVVSLVVGKRSEDNFNSIVMFQDLTMQFENQRRFHVSQKMEAIGQLAGGMAHNFNNLLTVISAAASSCDVEKLPEEAVVNLRMIEEAVEQAAEITQKMLILGQKQVSQSIATTFSVNEAIKRTVDILNKTVRKDIKITYQPSDKVGGVHIGASEFDQVLLNLAINARDAMPRGGVLNIRTSLKTLAKSLGDLVPGVYTMIEVEDSGEGIPQHLQNRIFEAFFTTKTGTGFGLGLSTAYEIIRRAGGQISLVSKEGEGTTFTILLPQVKSRPSLAMQAVKVPAPTQKKAKILLVDDMTLVRKALANLLKLSGHEVFEAENGLEAIGLLKTHEIDMLITDIIMPEMGGVDLAQVARKRSPDLPVILMSGHASDETIREALSRGIRLLLKPFTKDDLLREVRFNLGDLDE